MGKKKPAEITCDRISVSTPVEWRVADDGSTRTISGMAAVFDQETVIGGLFGFREKVAPGAFADALKRPDDVRALFNHDPNMLLGRTSSKTLRLAVTKEGLQYEADLPDTQAARDAWALVKRGDVNGSSFGFKVTGEEWDESALKTGGLPLRTITSVELFDVSPVTYPAYTQTTSEARSKAEEIWAGHTPDSSEDERESEGEIADLGGLREAREALERAKSWAG